MSHVAPLLDARELVKIYPAGRGAFGRASESLRAVDGVSFAIARGETLGLVGETGSGKSTTGRLLLRLETPSSGEIRLDGEDWLALSGRALQWKRREIQIVFQDPNGSLNPRMTVGDQVGEPLRVQGLARGKALAERVSELLASVGLSPSVARRHPAEFSGGQRQRIAIARALATGPRFLVCDEPVSALDVSVAAQILNLLADMREKTGLAMLFISHDLAVVSRVADRIAVMYRGRIVEEGTSSDLLRQPLHPYTAALLSAVSPRSRPSGAAPAGPCEPDAADRRGCTYHPRCPIAESRCREEVPSLEDVAPGRSAACFLPGRMTSHPGAPLPVHPV